MNTELSLNEQPESGISDLASSSQASLAQAEVYGALTIASRFPRNEDNARGGLIKSCGRTTFAALARYSYPRGGATVEGPTVNLAREAARLWGNIRYGFHVLSDEDSKIHIRGWAWDLQTNTKSETDARFSALIYRRKGGWQRPDERELRELVNKHGAVAERNAILKLMPRDLIEDALLASVATLTKGMSEAGTRDEQKNKIVAAFAGYSIPASELERFLQHPLAEVTAKELVDLRGIWNAIKDGARWSEYCPAEAKTDSKKADSVSVDDLMNATATTEERPGKPEPKADDKPAAKSKPKTKSKAKAKPKTEKPAPDVVYTESTGEQQVVKLDETPDDDAEFSQAQAEETEADGSQDTSPAERLEALKRMISEAQTAKMVDLLVNSAAQSGDYTEDQVEALAEFGEERKGVIQ